jgi:hypothetical protein
MVEGRQLFLLLQLGCATNKQFEGDTVQDKYVLCTCLATGRHRFISTTHFGYPSAHTCVTRLPLCDSQ